MLRKLITNNFWTKISSLCLAILVWLYASGEQNIEVTYEIPLQIKLPPTFVLLSINKDTLSVTLRGAKSILQQIELDKIRYSRDLSTNPQPGKVTFLVSENDIQIPKFVTVTRILPQEITLAIDTLSEKELVVEPMLTGTPADGFKVDGVSVSPTSVKLRGPESILKRSSKIKTLPVEMTGRNRSFFQKVSVETLLKGQEPEVMVEVYVRIREEVEEKVFDKHPIKILQSLDRDFETHLDPQTAVVVVGGNKETLSKLAPSEVIVFVDTADLKSGNYELPIQNKSPNDVTVLKITPSNVKINIKESAQSSN